MQGEEKKMGKTHWKKFQNPDYIGAYAFDEEREFTDEEQLAYNAFIAVQD